MDQTLEWAIQRMIKDALTPLLSDVRNIQDRVVELERRYQSHEHILASRGLCDVLHPVNVVELSDKVDSMGKTAFAIGETVKDMRPEIKASFDELKQSTIETLEKVQAMSGGMDLLDQLNGLDRRMMAFQDRLNMLSGTYAHHKHKVGEGHFSEEPDRTIGFYGPVAVARPIKKED